MNQNRLNSWFEKVSYIGSFLGTDLRKSIKTTLDLIVISLVQKKITWSGLRTNKPSFEKEYRIIVEAMGDALKEKFKDYTYVIMTDKLQSLLHCPKSK